MSLSSIQTGSPDGRTVQMQQSGFMQRPYTFSGFVSLRSIQGGSWPCTSGQLHRGQPPPPVILPFWQCADTG